MRRTVADILPATPPRPKFESKVFPVEAGGCPRCGHLVYGDIGPQDWCPCEDCHPGGYIVPKQQAQQQVS